LHYRLSEKPCWFCLNQSDVSAEAVNIGPAIIFERLWKETVIQHAIKKLQLFRFIRDR